MSWVVVEAGEAELEAGGQARLRRLVGSRHAVTVNTETLTDENRDIVR